MSPFALGPTRSIEDSAGLTSLDGAGPASSVETVTGPAPAPASAASPPGDDLRLMLVGVALLLDDCRLNVLSVAKMAEAHFGKDDGKGPTCPGPPAGHSI